MKSIMPMKKRNVPIAVWAIAIGEVDISAPTAGKHERQALPVMSRPRKRSHDPKPQDTGARS